MFCDACEHMLLLENQINSLTLCQFEMFGHSKINHCYSSCFCYCMRSWVVVWSLYVCDITVKTNIFLTLFGESGFNSDQGGNRKSNRQQGRHMKDKNKTERMSVRLVVSKHAWLWEETTNILTMLLTTTGAATQTICDFISHGNVYTNKKNTCVFMYKITFVFYQVTLTE